MKYQRAWAEINLTNLTHNLTMLKKHITKDVNVIGIVKADGYGHGAVPVANALLSAGVRSLGVATCEEGVQLREHGITVPILVMGFTPEPLLPYAIEHNLTQTVFTADGAKVLAEQSAVYDKRTTVHIEIDTGMRRLGFMPEDIETICEVARHPNLFLEGIFTHFATSDAIEEGFMLEQQVRFEGMLEEISKRGLDIPIKHMANSGALSQTLRADGKFSTDAQKKKLLLDAVRPGIMLYGHAPSAEMSQTCMNLDLKPVMRLMTQVSMVKKLPPGVGISYGHMYKTERESTIAVLPIGYADGYPRRLSRKGSVLVNGKFAPIAGAICMDQCMVDVTDIPDVKSGDPVVMLDTVDNKISAECLADTVGTISYEILCCIGKRVPRFYVSSVS
ncbi:MAG: alanine racemase [Defluviitaleaceae bacterium]|nr:alanine racemase [Defluviitaleaceae bacterium]